MNVSILSWLTTAVALVLNLAVLVGGTVWAVNARHRLGPLALRLLIAGLMVIAFDLVASILINTTAAWWATGSNEWRLQQIMLTNMVTTVIHTAGLALIIAAALVRRPADAVLMPPPPPAA